MLLCRVGSGGGVYIGISKNPTITPKVTNSVTPKYKTQWYRVAPKVATFESRSDQYRNLGGTDIVPTVKIPKLVDTETEISVALILVFANQRVGHPTQWLR